MREVTPLLPGRWVQWVFTPGIDIPESVNTLETCTVFIKFPTRLSADNYLAYELRGEVLDILRDQIRANKRNWHN